MCLWFIPLVYTFGSYLSDPFNKFNQALLARSLAQRVVQLLREGHIEAWMLEPSLIADSLRSHSLSHNWV